MLQIIAMNDLIFEISLKFHGKHENMVNISYHLNSFISVNPYHLYEHIIQIRLTDVLKNKQFKITNFKFENKYEE